MQVFDKPKGQRGVWTVRSPEICEGREIAVLHEEYYDAASGIHLSYGKVKHTDTAKYARLIEALTNPENDNLVILQKDAPRANLDGTFVRTGYRGLYGYSDLTVHEDGPIECTLTRVGIFRG